MDLYGIKKKKKKKTNKLNLESLAMNQNILKQSFNVALRKAYIFLAIFKNALSAQI
jgi:hypothetical protein